MFCKKIGTGLDNNQIAFTGKIPRNSIAKKSPLTDLIQLKSDVLMSEYAAVDLKFINRLQNLLKSFGRK